MPLAGHGLRPPLLRRRASRPQLKRDPFGRTRGPDPEMSIHPHSRALWPLAYLLLTTRAGAQQVVIRSATPAAVVEHLRTQLLPQGFKLESTNNKNALFTLDRGLVAQRGNPAVPVVHVVIELQFRFKQKADGLSVTANEEAVGERGRPLEFRKPVESEHDNLQRLLEAVRAELEAAVPPSDTVAKRDSSSP